METYIKLQSISFQQLIPNTTKNKMKINVILMVMAFCLILSANGKGESAEADARKGKRKGMTEDPRDSDPHYRRY